MLLVKLSAKKTANLLLETVVRIRNGGIGSILGGEAKSKNFKKSNMIIIYFSATISKIIIIISITIKILKKKTHDNNVDSKTN